MSDTPASLRGIRKPLLIGNGAALLSPEYRNFLIAVSNAVSNLKVMVSDGNGGALEADVKLTEMGLVIVLPGAEGSVGSGSLELTDGTTDLTGIQKITVSGAVVSGTSPNAILTIAASGGGIFQFRGIYNPAVTYNIYDVVQLQTGTSAGLYLSTIASNTNAPDTGIGWTQISSFATWL